mmetsp:Transcript_86321/g.244694  ORF Transcript_86321/g.244694 Transcript_86321/m.244694 type:complete len:201 (+) Transcript_86321:267-869(+)
MSSGKIPSDGGNWLGTSSPPPLPPPQQPPPPPPPPQPSSSLFASSTSTKVFFTEYVTRANEVSLKLLASTLIPCRFGCGDAAIPPLLQEAIGTSQRSSSTSQPASIQLPASLNCWQQLHKSWMEATLLCCLSDRAEQMRERACSSFGRSVLMRHLASAKRPRTAAEQAPPGAAGRFRRSTSSGAGSSAAVRWRTWPSTAA